MKEKLKNDHVTFVVDASLLLSFVSDAAVIEKDKAMTADKQLDGAAAVLFKTDSMSHKEYTPIKDLAERKGVPVGYISDVTSLSLVGRSVYEELKRLNV